MMAVYAPSAIEGAWRTISERIPGARLGGILPPSSSAYGYHNARNNLGSGDYSVQRAADKAGDGWAASALDVTMGPADMKTVTQRLITATQMGDPRLAALRSFLGTVNGTTVTGMDVTDKRFITSDPSHLWHVHLSIYRKFANDHAALQNVADVFTGYGSPEDTMLRQVHLFGIPANFRLTAGNWRTMSFSEWSPQNMSGSVSAVLPGAGTFISTLFVSLADLPIDGNVYLRLQTTDRSGNQRALYPISEHRATTGDNHFTFTQVGTVPADTNLRAMVAATHDCVVSAAQWRILY